MVEKHGEKSSSGVESGDVSIFEDTWTLLKTGDLFFTEINAEVRCVFEILEKLEHILRSNRNFAESCNLLLKKCHFLDIFDPTLGFLHISTWTL